MHIESPAFGPIDVTPESIVEFPAGLPGFADCRRFAFVAESDEPNVLQMQSVDDPQVVFSVTDPAALGVNYEFTLSDEEVAALALDAPEDVTIAVIVRKRDGSPAEAGLKANFMAPLIINTAARRGLQKVIEQVGCDVTLRGR
ncbi:flagellar assembly protein FliW [Nitrogeniibacter mangrovi]|uniref:Flagellar assembly factor FliW n=1 Tax=Nitrogeniibacter mangrovi TaxID=2016596 RepID=A0A6C1AZG4_9RHOO|nr:flagellar assembly protein FliW [Nitrogeniibacter mangrovi]QID16746.1 flagellar assembly protein FliW [Nitrogeniibacter mangrovi]